MKRRHDAIKPGVNVGFISLLMIFMTLCLATFSALALSTVEADRNLTKRTANSVRNYYIVENIGQTFICDLDELLARVNNETYSEEEYFNLVNQYMNRIIREGFVYDPEKKTIRVELEASERVLFVAGIQLNAPGDENRYTVTSWRIEPVDEDLSDKLDNIWDGELF
jgi:hypothetical protein